MLNMPSSRTYRGRIFVGGVVLVDTERRAVVTDIAARTVLLKLDILE